MKIAVVGAGFVGEATGKGLVKFGHQVVFIDSDLQKVTDLRKSDFQAYLSEEYVGITTDITMFCVPTPAKNKEIHLNLLANAVMAFAERLKRHKKYHVAVIRSAVPPGTTRDLVLPIIERISGKKAGKDFGLVVQPEYLRPATALEDYARPWFILIGALDAKAGHIIEKLYRPFDAPIEMCSLEEAEIQKYIHNAYNATKIAFFNEMRTSIKSMGWDADKVFTATAESAEGMWNPLFGSLDSGPVDASCETKDIHALRKWGAEHNSDFELLGSVIASNSQYKKKIARVIDIA